jgi:hypothetical protein
VVNSISLKEAKSSLFIMQNWLNATVLQ